MKFFIFALFISIFSSCSQSTNVEDPAIQSQTLNKVSIVSTTLSDEQKDELLNDAIVSDSDSL